MMFTLLHLVLILSHGVLAWSHQPQLKDSGQDINHPAQLNASEMFAFSAELSSNAMLAAGTTILFDQVLTNVGGLYFPNSGQFACPDDGLYVFIWSIMKTSNRDIPGMRCVAKLRKGGSEQKKGPRTSYYSTSYSGTAEMLAVSQCTTSPLTAITVMTDSWSETGLLAEYQYWYTSFSGFKLQATVAFTAELSADSYLIDKGRIMFDNVLSNFGERYDRINGAFRCPDDGIYVFSVSTYTRDPATPWSVSRLMKEEEMVVQGPITFIATESYDSGSASSTAAVQCTTGHSVYVEAQAAHHFLYNSYGSNLTAFSGYKLYDVTQDAVAFTAVMTNNHTSSYTDQPFMFDQVITNIGNAFDPTLSRFVCPDDYYYMFTWSATANYGSTSVNLHMNDTFVKYSYLTAQTTADSTGTSGTTSNSVILQCITGSRFDVRTRYVTERIVLGGYTMFTGYKIPGQ